MPDHSYKMQNTHDCGPCAVAFAICSFDNQFALPFANELKLIKERWGWGDHCDLRDNALDSPWHHFAVLKKSQYNWKIRTCGEILAGQCGNGKTVILLHDLSHPYLKQHWVVLHSVEYGYVIIHLGDGTLRKIAGDDFTRMYADGSPACAYEVGIGNGKLSWLQRFYVWATGVFR